MGKNEKISKGTSRHPWWRIPEYDKDGSLKQEYYYKFLKTGVWKATREQLPKKAIVRE